VRCIRQRGRAGVDGAVDEMMHSRRFRCMLRR
jgi:hypothetical protein